MKLKIITHAGVEYEVTVDSYDPIALNDQLNNHELNTVAIGEIIISRIDVKNVVPVTEYDIP